MNPLLIEIVPHSPQRRHCKQRNKFKHNDNTIIERKEGALVVETKPRSSVPPNTILNNSNTILDNASVGS